MRTNKDDGSSTVTHAAPPDDEAERLRLGIPDDPDGRRAWLRYRLSLVTHPTTGRGYTQADIARAVYASEATVSHIYRGTRINGPLADRVKRETARVLGIPERILFPAQASGDTGSQGEG